MRKMQEETQQALEKLRQENEDLRILKSAKKTSAEPSAQMENELRLTLEEVARLQNQLADANMRIVEAEKGTLSCSFVGTG